MKTLYQALLAAQKEIKHATKDASNPHYRSRYATLESVLDEVKPICNRHGLVIIQTNNKDDRGQYVQTSLVHADSGQSVDSKVYLLIAKPDMQGFGGSVTYARRYDLCALFGIGQEDDDGNTASNKPVDTQTKQWNSNNKKEAQSYVKQTTDL